MDIVDAVTGLAADKTKDLIPTKDDRKPEDRKPDELKAEEKKEAWYESKADWWDSGKGAEKDAGRDTSPAHLSADKPEEAKDKSQEVKSVAAGESRQEAVQAAAKVEQVSEKGTAREAAQERGGMANAPMPGDQLELSRERGGAQAAEASERDAGKVREQDKATPAPESNQAKAQEVKPEIDKAPEVSKNSRGQDFINEMFGTKDQKAEITRSKSADNEQKAERTAQKSHDAVRSRGMRL